ncbi:CubicO group peptidase (beta-lactamase class C family) [Sphaerisporangium siamense]|uniref:CubicO group peptidase (Beta-lactamase class C family) n=2 Tax=Sphaerisporangium siamense TaxID=795645 RepID=A0A7W7DD80_9ACTN|nr:CubicO group peptidase (beta-lactamase class C family) [Sphaerisporangium siamense]
MMFAVAIAALLAAFFAAPSSLPATAVSTGDHQLAQRVAALLPDSGLAGGSVGLSVAVIEHGKVRKAGLGTTDGSTPVQPETVFETGSAQKVLTATLLADLVETQDIKLTDTLAELWPDTRFADPAVAGITVEQLATHTAGLPSIPTRDDPGFPRALAGYLLADNAYASLNDPVRTLATMTGVHPGTDYSYSNLGYAALGQTLAKADGRDYATALRERVLAPLGMHHTTTRTTPGVPADAALPHGTAGVAAVPWMNPAWAAVGTGTWTTGSDLAAFLIATMRDDAPKPLTLTHRPRAKVSDFSAYDGRVGLGWQLWKANGTRVSWHNGLTNGSRSFIAHTGDDRAVIVLANSTRTPVEKIGFQLLKLSIPEFDEEQSPHPALLALTVLLALGAPALTLLGVARPRRSRLSRPLDRLKVISLLTAGTALWLLALRVGEWGHTPRLVWALGCVLLTNSVVLAAWRWRRLPTTRGRYLWLRWLTFSVPTLIFGALLYADVMVLIHLP